MAKVTVDEAACIGCGLCASLCPDVFEMDANNKAIIKGEAPEGQDMNDVASQCPVEAIKIS